MSPTSKRPDMAPQAFIGAVEDHWDMYSDRSEDYTIGSPIGFGASSIVYSAKYKPQGSSSAMPCALKVLDLDSLPPHSLSLLQRETTLMSLSKHPNVLRVRGSWMDGHKLFIALRLMNKGSAADVMHYGWPAGLEEDVIRCILRQALLGLNYLHINGFIHRDVKAANLLIDDDGTVLLGDLGVAANLAEDNSPSTSKLQTMSSRYVASPRQQNSSHDSQGSAASGHSSYGSTRRVVLVEPTATHSRPKIGKRKSFVGTPCWMAPELIQGKNYDSSADIWSFGITALELTQGRPPRSRESPQKVLLKTIQEAPPTLDRDGGTYKYSRAFQEMLESCLVKEPSQRPTAEQLLQTQFFKGAKKPSYLIATILSKSINLPPLAHRQERRVISSSQTHRSIDSWDFATTVHSLGGVPRHNQGGNVVFEMEDEGDRESGRSSRRSSHSGADEPERPVLVEDEPELESDLVQSPASSSHSGSDFQGGSTSTSPEIGLSTSPLFVHGDAEPKTSQPVKEISPPIFTAIIPPSSVPVKSKLDISTSPPQRGLWKKIKTNIRRSSSLIMVQKNLKV
ncbi:kinase-like domain-containing protein [Armillaria novae-zelandiae]|uniref:Kinase-like domain-containing protein n=1 Tax=Armillaria novae-zelandiae TaxID=153914 RepID=A0AA39NXL1_9AGAR|nr:kinase-like domain-containing protein [Armillaria novae-zelandiae]